MATILSITVSDEAMEAMALSLGGADRIQAYMQVQNDAVAAQHVDAQRARRLASKGLPMTLYTIGLKADQVALLEADADAKIAAKAAEAAAAEAAAKP